MFSFCTRVFIVFVFFSFLKTNLPYCDNNLCIKNGEFCCGRNECCFTWTLYYLWMALSLGVLIGVYFFIKCYYQKKNRLAKGSELNFKKNDEKKVINKHITYMPLKDAIFTENKIDEFNIQVISILSFEPIKFNFNFNFF